MPPDTKTRPKAPACAESPGDIKILDRKEQRRAYGAQFARILC
ncbi:hypothetical protein HMPREF3293_01344 [Christensenella minuta]|uniref:Uncharacterized protein n=1 Tax=Christensenella minuta TaxID=626937 RepID=A0A136Q5A3_9FIRM|nr:hypothetical protein HMPREF3293_01344 [Christensenella minuta]